MRQGSRCCVNQPRQYFGWKCSVDHRRFEIDDGIGRNNRLGEIAGGLGNPFLQRCIGFVPWTGFEPELRGIAADVQHFLLQNENRGAADQLLAARAIGLPARHRHRADRPGIAGAAQKKVAAHHKAAADECADENIQEIPVVPAFAKCQFRRAGRGRIIAQIYRHRHQRRDLGLDVEIAPLLHDVARRADLADPVPQLKGGGNSETGNAVDLGWRERCHHAGHAVPGKAGDDSGRGIGMGMADLGADAGAKIDHHEIAAFAADFQPEGKRPFGIERERHSWLADAATLRLAFQQEAIGLQAIDDDSGGLRRQAGEAGYLDLGQADVAADQRQDQALVVQPHAGLVAAAAAARTAQALRIARALLRQCLAIAPGHGRLQRHWRIRGHDSFGPTR